MKEGDDLISSIQEH